MGKILAIDWGEKKSGLAVSDEGQKFAFPFALVTGEPTDKILKIIEQEDIEKIVVGRPRNMDGSLGKQAKKVFAFAKRLEKKAGIPIEYEDETATSLLVKNQMIKEGLHPEKNRDLIDKRAAQIILEGYLHEKSR